MTTTTTTTTRRIVSYFFLSFILVIIIAISSSSCCCSATFVVSSISSESSTSTSTSTTTSYDTTETTTNANNEPDSSDYSSFVAEEEDYDFVSFYRMKILITITLIMISLFYIILFPNPLKQPLEYHNFADQRTCRFVLGGGCCGCRRRRCFLQNYNDVLSNIPFAIVSFIGIYHLFMISDSSTTTTDTDTDTDTDIINNNTLPLPLLPPPIFAKPTQEKRLWLIYYIGVGLVSIGSSYYHLKPNNSRLAFNRLPMTIAFVALTSIIIQDTICDISVEVLTIMIVIGISTVIYWYIVDDLRPYIIIQFGSIVIIPICYGLFGSKYYYDNSNNNNTTTTTTVVNHYVEAILLYVLAKVTEYNDQQIFVATGNRISGHTLKHLLSSIAAGWSIIILSSRSIN